MAIRSRSDLCGTFSSCTNECIQVRAGHLRCRFDCNRVERTSSRAGLHPLKSSAFSRRTVTTVTIRSRPTTRWKPLKSRSLAVSLQFSTELFTTNYRTNLTQMGEFVPTLIRV